MRKVYLLAVIFLFPLHLLAQTMIGAYTINAALPAGGTNFQSFNALATALQTNGVSGNVVIDVTPGSGPYNEQVVFQNIPGLGIGATVILNGNGEIISAPTTSTDRHIIRLKDLTWFTVNDLVINYDPASTGGFYGVHIFNSGDHITVSNCEINMIATSTLHGGIVASGLETSILDPGDFSNMQIMDNTVTGGGYGVSLYGEAANLATGINITGNTLYDWHSNGIYLRETNGVNVSGNLLDKRDAAITSANAIQLAQAANINAAVYNNRIHISQTNNGTMQLRGIYLFNGTGHKVFNNVISDIELTSGDFTAIEIRTGGTAPQISFNTIILDNPNTSSGILVGIGEELSNTNSVLRNNLILMTQPSTGVKTGMLLGAIATVTTAFNSNHNLFWVPGGNVATKGGTSPVNYATLANWIGASTQDMQSLGIDPVLVNEIPTNAAADNAGISIPGIVADITGTPRAATPDIGAYEFLTTGIVSLNNLNNVNVYPNPAKDLINVTLPSAVIHAEAIQADGKKISLEFRSDGHRTTIMTDGLAPGYYRLLFQSEREVYNAAVVITD